MNSENQAVLHGIISWGTVCEADRKPQESPGVYARIHEHGTYNWIKNKITDDSQNLSAWSEWSEWIGKSDVRFLGSKYSNARLY